MLKFALALLTLVSPAFSQISAAVSGTVTDPSGATISAAAVTAKNSDTGTTRATVTDGSGRYRLFALAVGEYEIHVQKQGFTEKVRKGVHLTVGRDATVDASLEVGDVSQQVVVNADASPVSTTETGASGTVRCSDTPRSTRHKDSAMNMRLSIATGRSS